MQKLQKNELVKQEERYVDKETENPNRGRKENHQGW